MIPVIECKTQEHFDIIANEIKHIKKLSSRLYEDYKDKTYIELNGEYSCYSPKEEWDKEIEAGTHKLYTFEEWCREFKPELITETNQVDDYSYLIKLLKNIDNERI